MVKSELSGADWEDQTEVQGQAVKLFCMKALLYPTEEPPRRPLRPTTRDKIKLFLVLISID